ncbi:ROK family transcriptional regulator [Salicibibacter kimchii]|uniref:ROK family transcriptional regulator n=1 Tax=Salicibibacter kimchii TaxID=2099786 RepID=A0A345C1G2_9BACI|nr:ROK family transcriptional regulator [Salicibibacter kimchii]AXF57043.1 ROK family transcriptional regulator [Salicibibacter kimchii]
MLKDILEMTTQKGNNLRTLYQCVRNEGDLTRAEISERTGLKLSTCTRLIDELIEKKLIYESGEAASSGGRKPKKYSIEPAANYIIGIDISRFFSKVLLMRLDLVVLEEEKFDMNSESHPTVVVQQFIESIHKMLRKHELVSSSLLGVGVSAIGPLDTENGIIKDPLHFPASGWKNVPITKMLKDAFHTKVVLDYGENTALDAEYRHGAGKDHKNVVYINKGVGIRLGLMLNGEILRSSGGDKVGAFGQGHMVVDIHGKKCICGNYGCMNAYSTIPALTEEIRDRLKEGRPSLLHDKVNDATDLTFAQVLNGLEQRDETCEQAVKDIALYSAAGVANLIIIFHPSKIILSGPLYRNVPLYYESVIEGAKSRYNKLFPQLEVAFSQGELGENAAGIGAGSLVLDSLL